MELFAFDKEYVERLRAGDAATEAHFVAYFDQLLRILLRARMLTPDKVEDVTQETFKRVLAAVRAEGAIRGRRSALAPSLTLSARMLYMSGSASGKRGRSAG